MIDLSNVSTHALLEEVTRRVQYVKTMREGDPIPVWFELDEEHAA